MPMLISAIWSGISYPNAVIEFPNGTTAMVIIAGTKSIAGASTYSGFIYVIWDEILLKEEL